MSGGQDGMFNRRLLTVMEEEEQPSGSRHRSAERFQFWVFSLSLSLLAEEPGGRMSLMTGDVFFFFFFFSDVMSASGSTTFYYSIFFAVFVCFFMQKSSSRTK